MAITNQDKAFIQKRLQEGKTLDEAYLILKDVKAKKGLTGGTFMTRAASVAENSAAPQAVQDKATAAKEDIQAQGSEYAKKPSLVEETVEAVGNIKNPQIQAIVGAGQGIAESSLNLLGMGEKASNYLMGNKDVPTLSETILESETGKRLLTPQNQTQSASKFLGEVATPLAIGSPVTGALRGAGSAKAAAMGGGKFLQGLSGTLAASGPETALITGGMEGRLPTTKELGQGAAIDAATMGIGGLLSKYAPDIFRIGANPKGKNYTDIEWKAGEATGKYYGTKKMIVNQANDVISASSKEMDELLEPINTTYTRSELAEGALSMATDLEKANPAQANDILNYTDEWITAAGNKNQTVTAKELREMKTTIGETLSNVFAKGRVGDPKVAAQGQALIGIWGKIDEALDAISPKVKDLNQQMNVAYSLKSPLEGELEKPFLRGILQMLSSAKNVPLVTPATTLSAGGMKKLSALLDTPGVPASVKAGILDLFGSEGLDQDTSDSNLP